MMNRKTITSRFFTATFLATLSFTVLLACLGSAVRAGNKVNMAYVSDAPGSAAAYWVASYAGNPRLKILSIYVSLTN